MQTHVGLYTPAKNKRRQTSQSFYFPQTFIIIINMSSNRTPFAWTCCSTHIPAWCNFRRQSHFVVWPGGSARLQTEKKWKTHRFKCYIYLTSALFDNPDIQLPLTKPLVVASPNSISRAPTFPSPFAAQVPWLFFCVSALSPPLFYGSVLPLPSLPLTPNPTPYTLQRTAFVRFGRKQGPHCHPSLLLDCPE